LAEGSSAGRRYQNAKHFRAYADGAAHPWIYLVDGAVSDNLGLHRVFDAVANRRGLRELMRARGIEHARRFVFVIVNAQVPPAAQWDNREAAPGTLDMIDAAASAQMNRYSFETVDLLRRSIGDWSREFTRDGLPPPDSYVIEVGFDQLNDEQERRSFGGIPTTYDLPDAEIDRLRDVGGRLLRDAPDFQRLLHDLGGQVASVR
jgi:NTE family protein